MNFFRLEARSLVFKAPADWSLFSMTFSTVEWWEPEKAREKSVGTPRRKKGVFERFYRKIITSNEIF